MRTVKRISGEVLGWVDTSFIVRDVVQKHNDGYLELYSQELDLLHRRDEIRRYFTTEINKGLFFYQEDDFGNINIFNGNDLQDYGIIEGSIKLERRRGIRITSLSLMRMNPGNITTWTKIQ
jgi:hypothetical protein